jgi:hypothetical protein
VIETESQELLNATEHDFQDAFRNGRSAGNRAYAQKGGLFGGGGRLWPVGPTLVFDQMAEPVPEIMVGSLYNTVWKSLLHAFVVVCITLN